MQTSIFDLLNDSKPRHHYSTLRERRIAILEANLAELEKYHTRCPKNKRQTLARMIDRHSRLLSRLTRYSKMITA